MSDDLEFRVAKLQLAPGDLLVVKTDRTLTQESAASIRDALARVAPGCKVLILDGDVTLDVLTRSEIEAKAA